MTFTKSLPVAAPSPAARKSPLRAATLGGVDAKRRRGDLY